MQHWDLNIASSEMQRVVIGKGVVWHGQNGQGQVARIGEAVASRP